ncbi:MAG: ATP-dependent helicase, partial [Gemmiger sp.]
MSESITSEFLKLRDQYIASRFTRLNPVQREAVFTTQGPLLILAGAGSGKTTVLVNRIANIIRFGCAYGSTELSRPVGEEDLYHLRACLQGQTPSRELQQLLSVRAARPWNVLAITFTNKAAGELKERLKAMLGETMGGDVHASTFHSACVRILRRDAERIGFPTSFTIYDSDDQQRVIKQIYKELMIDDKFLPPKTAIARISGFKDKLLSAEAVAADTPRDTKAGLVSKIYTAYAARLKNAGAMDFDDLIFHTVKMLQT